MVEAEQFLHRQDLARKHTAADDEHALARAASGRGRVYCGSSESSRHFPWASQNSRANVNMLSMREKSSMKRTGILSAAVVVLAMAVAGCANTVKGIGEDTANTVDATKEAGKDIAKAVE